VQRKIRSKLPPGTNRITEFEKFYPGIAPPHVKKPAEKKKGPRQTQRHAFRAGGIDDIFKQIVVQTVIDLKVSKKETPVWYVEICGGEGEYHVNRLQQKGEETKKVLGPTAEQVFDVLKDKDLTYLPPEIKGWFEATKFLNSPDQEFEVRGNSELRPNFEGDGIEWLSSTLLVALQTLRPQDPVTIFEDNPVCFASLFNFVRNFSSKVKPHIELIFNDGFQMARKMWMWKKVDSKAHGKYAGQRGLVLMDPDWNRGSEAKRCQDVLLALATKHWRSATVMITYPIASTYEEKARKLRDDIRELDPNLDLLEAELYIDTPGWTLESDVPRWQGVGALIAQPPYTTAERIRSALTVLSEELAGVPGAESMRINVATVKPGEKLLK